MSTRSCLVNQPDDNLILTNEQLFKATELLTITFSIILKPNLRRKNLMNSQIHPKIRRMRIKF